APAGPGLSVEVLDACAPGEAPGEAGPPPHRHPWDEIYVVLNGILAVFDGETWREAPAGACVTVPALQWHAYRNGTDDCRFLTITGPGRARPLFSRLPRPHTRRPPPRAGARIFSQTPPPRPPPPPGGGGPPALATRHDVEVMAAQAEAGR